MSHWKMILIVGTGALCIGGCSSKVEPATQAVVSVETALNDVRVDAARYAPEDLRDANAALAALKSDLATEEYRAVLEEAPKVYEEIGRLKETVVARQTQVAAATREWEELRDAVPRLVDAIQYRVDHLSGSRLPENIEKESLETAKVELKTLKSQWAEARAAFAAGHATEAADKGRMVQAKATAISRQLGISA